MTWNVEFEGTVPVRMRWDGECRRRLVHCPRSWPHAAHGPWYGWGVWHPLDNRARVFDCPGVPFPAREAS